MAVVVLGGGLCSNALVVVVVRVAVRMAKMPTATAVVASNRVILCIACHGSTEGRSITLLNRVYRGGGGPSSSNDPHTSINAGCILPLL